MNPHGHIREIRDGEPVKAGEIPLTDLEAESLRLQSELARRRFYRQHAQARGVDPRPAMLRKAGRNKY